MQAVFEAQQRHRELSRQVADARKSGRTGDEYLLPLKAATTLLNSAIEDAKYKIAAETRLRSSAASTQDCLHSDPEGFADTAAFVLGVLGRHDDAERVTLWKISLLHRDRASQLQHAGIHLAHIQLRAGRPDDAIATAIALQVDGGRPADGNAVLAIALLLKGDIPRASELVAQLQGSFRSKISAMVEHSLGHTAAADAQLSQMSGETAAALLDRAEVHAWRGERDHAFECLNRAVLARNSLDVLFNVGSMPFLATMGSDARWVPFLERLYQAPEQLATIPFSIPDVIPPLAAV